MSYKFSTGSVRRGDIYYEDDRVGAATYIDFGYDTITLRPSASAILFAEHDAVGIGTTSPQTTLHVKGDPGQFRVEDTTVDYAYTIDCDGDGIRTHFGDMTGDGDEDSFMSFGAYTGINRLDTAARDFHIYGTNTTTGFYFDESEGMFGIGTTAPAAYLDIKNTTDDGANNRTMIQLYNYRSDDADENDWAPTSIDFKIENVAGGVKGATARIATVIAPVGTEHNSTEGEKSSALIFSTMDDATLAEAARINNLGYLGVGTTNPGSKLQVSGSVAFNVTSFSADMNINETHYTCIGNCGGGGGNGNVTLTLPAATDAMTGRVYVFKRADTGTSAPGGSTLLVARNGAYIDGDTDNLQLGNGDCYTIQCVGQSLGWIVLGSYVPI